MDSLTVWTGYQLTSSEAFTSSFSRSHPKTGQNPPDGVPEWQLREDSGRPENPPRPDRENAGDKREDQKGNGEPETRRMRNG